MATTNYKNKKGSTGKKYTTYGDRIKVTYTDGSTRVVRPSDASYNATKKAMESDIANRKLIGNKKSNTTAETALGAGKKDTSLIASATVNDKAKEATQKRKVETQKRKADQAAGDKTMKASERAAIVNQYSAMNAHKTAQSAAKKVPETVGYSVESGQNQFAGGLQAAPYVVAQDLLTTFKGKNASIDNVKNPLRPNHSLGDTLREIAARQAQRQNEIQQKYGYDNFSGGQKLAADVGSGIANMAPSLFLAPISGGASLAAMGITAAGSAANKALNEGATLQDASTYGIRSGAIEAGTELIGGGIPLLPSILKGGKVAAKVGGTAGKVLGHAADIGMEGAEEAMSEALDPWNQRTSYNPDVQNATAEELARAALLGSLTSGVLKGVAGGVNLANTARQPKDITPKLVKAGQNVRQEQNNAQNEQQNFQTTQKNQIANAENAQNGIQQPINNQTINTITNQNNAPQNETSKADFPQTQKNPKDIRPMLKRPTPEPTIPMEQRNFDNVKDKNVLAYQQEHPEVKPYQQAVANQLLADLDMGVKGGRDVGIDPETRNVTQRGGWKRQQSEPVNRMLEAGLSYQKIRKGLNDIVEDNGKENNTTAKRVELYVNDAVVNGYNSITEGRVEQNNAYHYRGMSREQLLKEQSRLENNFTGNIETDNAIIRELETIHGLLQQMPEQKAQPVNNDITPKLQTAEQAMRNQQPEPTVAENTTVADDSSATEYKDYDVSQLPKDVFDFYNQVGEVGGKAHFNIRFVQNLEYDAEGKSDGRGNILISAERANDIETLRRVVAHECYHAMKNTDQWKDIQDLAYKLYKLENPNGTKEQMLQAKIDQYYKRSGGKVQLDKEGAWDEVGAELMGEILSDPKMADRIWNQNPTLAQRITRWLEDMVRKLHDFVFEVEAEDSIYRKAFEAYNEGLQSMRWQRSQQSEIRYGFSGKKLPNQKYIDQSDENLRNFMEGSAVVNEDGSPKVVYSGHANTNLFGSKFDIKKATSGGFYFTESPEIASSYAEDKLGVMEQYEDGSEYRFYDEKGNPTRRISDVRLTPEQIDIFENKLSDEDDGILGMTYPEYLENVAKYNDQLKWLPRNKYSLTLADIYNIFDQEGLTIHYNKKRSQFEDLLQEFGLEWDSYLQKKQGVFPVYLSIKNPIDTSKPMPLALMGAFEREAAKDRKTYTFDQLDRLRWTADYPMKQWVEDIRRDQENGTAGWSTTIPKKARKIMLEMGYDGIKDTGGKMGGVEHEVWIAFEPNQIKSAIGNRGTFDPTKKDIRYSIDNPQQENVDKYGAIPPGENPYGNNRDIQVPQQTEDDNRVGRFNRTAAEARQTDDQTVDILMRELRTYKPSSNQKQMNYANNVIGSVGWESAADSFQTDFRAGKRMTANDVAIGERCIQEAQKAGDYKKAAELIGDVASLGVELGQAVQAMSMLKRLTPEGRLMALKRVQQRINADLQQKSKKKKNKNDITPKLKRAGESSGQAQQNAIQQDLGFKPVTISPETEQRILEARGQKAMDEAWDAAVQEMADQVDATLLDKVRAWRYLSMLSNPRTHIRNLLGNGVKRGVTGIEHQIQAGLEAAFVKDGGERYRTFKKVPKEYKEFAEWDFETNIRRQMEQTGSRYNDAIGQINRNKRIFKPNALETWRKTNENALAQEDMWFKKEAYINAFANYMLANNLSPSVLQSNANATSTYKAAQVYAKQKAYEATFQEANKVATLLSQLEHSSKAGAVIVGALMPFKTTPLNILKQGTMVYSPIGLVKGIANAMTKVKSGEMTQVEAIEQISRGFTGTGIAAIGALMMSLGMIALGGDDDKRKAAYDRQMGDQTYAFKFKDGSTYSIDWLSPSVMPLLMGAEIYDTVKRASNGELTDQSIMSAVTSSLMRIGDPLLEMSCMSGFADALSSYSEGGTEALSNIIGTSIKNYAGQFIPAPLGALARTIDDTVRSSYASKDSSIGKGAEQFLRQQRSKIPMVSMQNEASIDVWGNERKREGAGDGIENVAFRAFNNFVNPGNYSSNKRTALDNELERLYQSTGDSGIFPAVASGTINESKQNPKISMTPLEFSKFSTTKGGKSQQYVSDFVNSEAYDQLDDSEKADIISSLYDLANYEARKQTLRNRGYDYSQENYENVLTEITENKITPAEYYSQKSLVGDSITGTYSEVKRQMKICDKMGMDYEAYHTASTYLNKLRSSTDENGKTIKGNAAKDKKFAALKKWVEEGDVTEEQAWYLWTEEYNSNNRKNDDGYMHWRDCPYQWIIDNKEYEKAMEAEKRKNVE